MISRLRRDAALHHAAPPRTGRRGRPPTKGARLGTPAQLAAKVAANKRTKATLDCRGQPVEALVWSRPVLSYGVDPRHLVLLVVTKDPTGRQPLDFFICTDTDADAAWVGAHHTGRWSIECVFRQAKQVLGAKNPQS